MRGNNKRIGRNYLIQDLTIVKTIFEHRTEPYAKPFICMYGLFNSPTNPIRWE